MSPLFLLIPILFPMVAGFLLIPIGLKAEEDRKRNLYAEAVVVVTSVLVWVMLFAVKRETVEIYSFSRRFSIDLSIDGLGCLFAGMISIMWPLVMLYAFEYMRETKRKNMFFAFYIMTYGMTLGVCFAANMVTMYVFYEMLSLVTIPLVFYYEDRDSRFAARKYAAYTIGGASLGFFTVVMTTYFGESGAFLYGGSLGELEPSRLMQIAFVFGFFGFGVKAAVFPFHDWLPTASVAPTPVTALLHAVAVVNSGVFAVVRLVWYTYGPDYLAGTWAQRIPLAFSIFTLVFAAALAIKERHFKRRLAYSTISNLSYMLFAVMLLTPLGLEAGLMHMLFHGIIKMSLFLCAGAFMHVTGSSYLYEINGVGKRMPYTFAFYTLASLSLTGIPMFCGFVSKWNLVMAGLESGKQLGVIGAFALILSAFLCAIYTLSVSVRAFFPIKGTDRFAESKDPIHEPKLMLIPIAVFGILNIILGIWPQPVIRFLQMIAQGQI